MSLYLLLLAVAVFWLGVSLSQRRLVGSELEEAAALPFIEEPQVDSPGRSGDLFQA